MATLSEAMNDLARALVLNPGHFEVSVWRRNEEWLWILGGEPHPPDGYELALSDRVDNSDADATDDPQHITRYAQDLEVWARGLV